MDHQDWDEVSWDKRGVRAKGESRDQQVQRALRTGSAAVVAEKRFAAGSNPAARSAAAGGPGAMAHKLDEETEAFRVERPTMEMRKLLQQERMKAGLTQVELAQMCNVKPAIIQEYEQGKGIPNPTMLMKIERALRAKNPSMVFGTLTKAQKAGKA